FAETPQYFWPHQKNTTRVLKKQISLPTGYVRVQYKKNSFQSWLQFLPLKKRGQQVLLYNGQKKGNQNAHFAVIDIDVGRRDLQQCADAIIRLKAEYLYSQKKYSQIQFNFTSGDRAFFSKWIKGFRPKIRRNRVSWIKRKKYNLSYQNFRKYLNVVFIYAGSYSLQKELKKVAIKNIQVGDIFIQGGFPGHAIIVVDVAVHQKTKQKVFALVQSFMPAQQMHILKNPKYHKTSPWFSIPVNNTTLNTPEWTFKKSDLYRF
ncbi:MAG: hypothetical protein ACI86H_001764, partial [bacterium]